MFESSSEARTLPPSERRRAQVRRAGEVAFSRDAVAAAALAGACIALIAGGRGLVGGLLAYVRLALAGAGGPGASWSDGVDRGLAAATTAVALPTAVVLVVSLLAGLAQTRGVFAGENLRVRAQRLVPLLGRVLGRERAGDVAWDLGKILVLATVAGASLLSCLDGLSALAGADAARVLGGLGVSARRLGSYLAIAMLALGTVDYLRQWLRHQGRLRMTHGEARREEKEAEGDPEHKAERRRRQGELQTAAALADVAQADLILILPGSAAAAITCQDGADEPPRLLARGEHLRGRQIEAAARAAGRPVVIEPALVRALAFLPEGEAIPESHHEAIARLLVRVKNRQNSLRPPAMMPDGRRE